MGKEFSLEEQARLHREHTLSDAKLLEEGATYAMSKGEPRLEIDVEKQYERLHQEMEKILAERLLTPETLKDGSASVSVEKIPDEVTKLIAEGLIHYEFEIETETRYVIAPQNVEAFEWKTHVFDTYDKSGRARIRVKNDEPRLSLKVPLFTKDTATHKTCLRLEFKPTNTEQSNDLLRIKKLILKEAGAQTSEKWGAQLKMANGEKVWINRDADNNWWIEVDEGVDFQVPEGIEVLEIRKSSVKT